MEITHTEPKRGNKAIIVDGYMYRRINVLKNGDIVYLCSIKKNCSKSITTDSGGVAIIKTKNQHVCGYDPTVRKAEANLSNYASDLGQTPEMSLNVHQRLLEMSYKLWRKVTCNPKILQMQH